ncbi:MAG: SMC-Scp complex subunit ScpB [Chloroflexi bacterium]|nr:MAG: SMC-Scp complex subunit ScpB [Chloroflexota bacterium]
MTTDAAVEPTTDLAPEETQGEAVEEATAAVEVIDSTEDAAAEAALADESGEAAEEEAEEFEGQTPAFPAERVPYLIESLLFVSDGPTDEGALARALGLSRREVRAGLDNLGESLRERGIRLQRGPDGIQLVTAPDTSTYIEQFLGLEAGRRLSAAALETLAIIAYRQPVTRGTLEAIRGVNCDGAIDTLRNRGLIDIAGRADGPGRPALFATTQKFLEYFGLEKPEDLPPLPADIVEAANRLPENLSQQLPLSGAAPTDAATEEVAEESTDLNVPEAIETPEGRVWPARGGLPYAGISLPGGATSIPPMGAPSLPPGATFNL